MKTNKHNMTTFFATLAAAFLLSVVASDATAKENTPWPGAGPAIGDSFDVTGNTGPSPEISSPGQWGSPDPGLPPLGYIDIPEIDRGPDEGGDGNAESNAPPLPGTNGFNPLDIFGPSVPFDGFFNQIDFIMGAGQVTGTDQSTSGMGYADLLYTEAPDIELSLDNKPIPGVDASGGVDAVPTPGAVGLGLIAGASMVRRKRR